MRRTTLLACTALVFVIGFCAVPSRADQPATNLIANGGFEQVTEGWSWGQWQGLPEPGFLDRRDPYAGRASYVMTLAGIEGARSIITTTQLGPDRGRDYVVSMALRGRDLPEQSVRVSLLQWGTEKSATIKPQGWITLPGSPGKADVLTVGGTFDWRVFKVHLYRQSIKSSTKRVSLYIKQTAIGTGELGIDNVSLVPVEPVPYKKTAPPNAEPQPRPTETKRATSKKTPGAATSEAGNLKSKDVLLSRCDSTRGWGLTLGKEFPGAKGKLTTEMDHGRDVLKVDFDLSKGGRYVGVAYRATTESAVIGNAEAILVDARGVGLSSLGIRVRDATGQVHAAGFRVTRDAWQTVVLPLTSETFTQHWGGAKDQKLHFPLKEITIVSATGKGAKGSFLLRNFGIRQVAPQRTWNISVTTDQPGHIHFLEEDAKVNVTVRTVNGLREQRTVPLAIDVVDLDGKEVLSESTIIQFAPWSANTRSLSLATPGLGYFHVRVRVGEGATQQRGEGAFGVVHQPLRYRQRDPKSAFGMHGADPEISPRLGVHWYRYYQQWQWAEYHEGQYSHPTEQLRRCFDAGIDILMCLDYREPGWLKPAVTADGLPTDAAMRHYADFVRSTVREHPFVAVFEIQNEPDLEIMAHRNLSLEKALEFYARICKTIVPIIRKEAPGVPIAGSPVSGQDQTSDFRFSRNALQQPGVSFDIWSPHPYASPRTFGPGLAPLSPEENRETEKHRRTLAVIRELGKDYKYWVGEKGWAIKDTALLFGKSSRSFADYCARSLIIAQSVPGVEKYMWFAQTMEHALGTKYALFRGKPLQPMPAAVAYANVAYRLDHARAVASLRLANDRIRVCVFERPMTDTALTAVWSLSTPLVLETKLPAGTNVFDLYGRRIVARPLRLTETPLFIQTAGAHAGPLVSTMKRARFQPAEPFEVVAAYFADLRTLRIGLNNNTSQVVRIEGQADGAQGRIALLPNREHATWLQIELPRSIANRAGRPVPITLAPRDGKPVAMELSTNLAAVARRSGMTIDGRTDDWQGVQPLVLNTRAHVLPPDEAGWRGPEDLSVWMYSAWDAHNLYLLVRVTDDKHTTTGDGTFWTKDCLRVAIDVMNDASLTGHFGADDREFGVLLDDAGAHTFQCFPQLATFSAKFPVAGKRIGKETLYEMAFPWSQLGRVPKAGMVFSLNLVAVDNDGAGANYWIGITPGIVETKRPSLYRDFFLTN